MFEANMRESPNGMASASQADSRGFDSRLSLQKREAFLGFSFLESCIRIEPQAHAKHGSTAAVCPAPVGSGSKSLAPSRRKLPSPAPSHRRTHVTTYGNGMSCVCRFGLEEPCAPAAQTPVSCSFPQAHAKHGSTAAACPASVGSGSKSLAPSRRKLPSFACSGAIRL